MRFNKNFAKSEDGKKLAFAPAEFDFGGVHYNATNSEEIYKKLGFYKFVKSEMPVKGGCYFTPYYEKENEKLYQKWEEHEISVSEDKLFEEEQA